MKAVRLKQVDQDYRNHLQAWLTFSAQATNKKGKPAYKVFKKFYNYKDELEKVDEKEDKNEFIAEFGRRFLKKGE